MKVLIIPRLASSNAMKKSLKTGKGLDPVYITTIFPATLIYKTFTFAQSTKLLWLGTKFQGIVWGKGWWGLCLLILVSNWKVNIIDW